jgi:hypothetical protein
MPTKKQINNRNHYLAHREEVCRKNREYRQAHRDEMIAYERQYRQAHREERKITRNTYYAAHRDRINASQRDYREAHKGRINELARASYHRRKAAKQTGQVVKQIATVKKIRVVKWLPETCRLPGCQVKLAAQAKREYQGYCCRAHYLASFRAYNPQKDFL